jgi:hypothetical protein
MLPRSVTTDSSLKGQGCHRCVTGCLLPRLLFPRSGAIETEVHLSITDTRPEPIGVRAARPWMSTSHHEVYIPSHDEEVRLRRPPHQRQVDQHDVALRAQCTCDAAWSIA